MPNVGRRGYKGPVHEAVRKSPLGGLVKTKKRTKSDLREKQMEALKKSQTGGARKRYVQDKTYALMKSHGYGYGEATKTANEAYQREQRAKAMRKRAAQKSSAKAKTVGKASKSRGKPASGTGTRIARTRAVGSAAKKVAARNPNLSRAEARAKARSIVKKRGR